MSKDLRSFSVQQNVTEITTVGSHQAAGQQQHFLLQVFLTTSSAVMHPAANWSENLVSVLSPSWIKSSGAKECQFLALKPCLSYELSSSALMGMGQARTWGTTLPRTPAELCRETSMVLPIQLWDHIPNCFSIVSQIWLKEFRMSLQVAIEGLANRPDEAFQAV